MFSIMAVEVASYKDRPAEILNVYKFWADEFASKTYNNLFVNCNKALEQA